MKLGVIVTLYKGGNKRKDLPASYRAISLTSVILKVFESVIMARCTEKISNELSTLQGGFKERLGCLLTSFVVRDCVYFSRENNSKLFICFHDGRQAFDRVWLRGLFFKLLDVDLDATTRSELC